jgi:DNA-binding beta-propeller fold protein YncE
LLRNITVALAMVTALASCNKDPIRERPVDPPVPPDSVSFKNGCFIVNEGNYNWGNASVTFINQSTGNVEQDVFAAANQRSLGDVAQSMTVFNGRGYIVVNNSNKVEVVSLDDFKTIKTIQGFSSPRYFTVVDSTRAYVTNLHGNISIVDLNTLEVTGNIETPDWTEGMVRYQQYVFITSIGRFSESTAVRKSKVYIINTKQDKIVDSIMTGKEPMGIVIDKKDKIWVLCTGGWDAFEPPALLRVNPDLREVEKAFVFEGNNGVPSRLCISPGRDTLYFLKNGVFRMPVASGTLPSQAFISSEDKLFYGLDVDPYTGRLWTSNAVDYVQNGWVYEYDASSGTLLNSFKAGRIPGSFAFSSGE